MARALDPENGPLVLDPVRDEDVADPLALDPEAERKEPLLEDHGTVEARDDQVAGSVPPGREDDRDLLRCEHAPAVVDRDPTVGVRVESDSEVGPLRDHGPCRGGERGLGRARTPPGKHPVHLAVPDDRFAPGQREDPPHLPGRPVAHVQDDPERTVERDAVRDERAVPVDRLVRRTADELPLARGERTAPVVLHDRALLVEEAVAVPGSETDPVVLGRVVRGRDVGRTGEPVLPGHEARSRRSEGRRTPRHGRRSRGRPRGTRPRGPGRSSGCRGRRSPSPRRALSRRPGRWWSPRPPRARSRRRRARRTP